MIGLVGRVTSRTARALLDRLLLGTDRVYLRGDLDELHRERQERWGTNRAGLWLLWQAIRAATGRAAWRAGSNAALVASGVVLLVRGSGRDWRFALGSLRRDASVSTAAILTLALVIGANTAAFSLVNFTLLLPLPYPNAAQLVKLWRTQAEGESRGRVSPAEFLDWRTGTSSFEQLATYMYTGANLEEIDRPERVELGRVSTGFFAALGVSPRLGRSFVTGEDQREPARVVIVSHGFWMRRLDADPAVLGSDLRLGSVPHEIVGVLPADFAWVVPIDLWTPQALNPDDRASGFLRTVGMLRDGVTLQQAQDELTALAAGQAERFPEYNDGYGIRAVTMHEDEMGDTWPVALLLQGVVGLVLLIGCANVANLLLVRGSARQQELAVRAALGAGRRELARLVLLEGLILGLIGGALGIAAAIYGLRLLTSALELDPVLFRGLAVDGTVVAFTAALATLTALVFSLLPAIRAGRLELRDALAETAKVGVGKQRQRALRALVVAQVATAATLVIGAVLLLQTIRELQHVEMGFDTRRVLALEVSLSTTRYSESADWIRFHDELRSRLNRLPTTESVGAVLFLPLGSSWQSNRFLIEGQPPLPVGQLPSALSNRVGPGYFRSMGIPLLRGRLLDARDDPESPTGAVVSAGFAARHWPDENPLGKRFSNDGDNWITVAGVVGDVRQHGPSSDLEPHVYLSLAQLPSSRMVFLVRSSPDSDMASVASAARTALAEIDPIQPLFNVQALQELHHGSLARPRIISQMITGFALVALLLAAVGVYGVVSRTVEQRRHEIGIRVSLGALRRDVFTLMLRQGARLVGLGVGLGLFGGYALGRVLASLTGSDAFSLLSFASTVALLFAVGIIACAVPALRSSRLDPVRALRAG